MNILQDRSEFSTGRVVVAAENTCIDVVTIARELPRTVRTLAKRAIGAAGAIKPSLH